jgi:hypothetical protein
MDTHLVLDLLCFVLSVFWVYSTSVIVGFWRKTWDNFVLFLFARNLLLLPGNPKSLSLSSHSNNFTRISVAYRTDRHMVDLVIRRVRKLFFDHTFKSFSVKLFWCSTLEHLIVHILDLLWLPSLTIFPLILYKMFLISSSFCYFYPLCPKEYMLYGLTFKVSFLKAKLSYWCFSPTFYFFPEFCQLSFQFLLSHHLWFLHFCFMILAYTGDVLVC